MRVLNTVVAAATLSWARSDEVATKGGLDGPALEVEIAQSQFEGIADAVWDLEVVSQCDTSPGQTVFSQRVIFNCDDDAHDTT